MRTSEATTTRSPVNRSRLKPPRLNRRRLEVALGLLWLLDGGLQLQPDMFAHGFFASMLSMAGMGLPGPASSVDSAVVTLLVAHPVVWNAIFGAIQLALGAGLLWPRTARVALAASIPWALGVWAVGEGIGGLFMGGTSLLTGAPGAAILYAVIAVLVWPTVDHGHPRRTDSGLARFAVVAWAFVWVSGALLEIAATNNASTVPGAQVVDSAAGQLGVMRVFNDAVGRLVAGQGPLFAAVLGLAATAIGLGILHRRTRRAALVGGIVVGVFVGVVGQDLGALFSGQATDPGSGPLVVLFALAVWLLTAPTGQSEPGRSLGSIRSSTARSPSRLTV